ncbi:MAG TPA: tetratricopeptide repeat protein, partial [Gammaproteobacteria bacterium]|nr:tetratricopeptide repeat protein [Gammaproteobacteria bacterium]
MDIERRHQEALELFRRGEIDATEQSCLTALREERLPGFLHLLGMCQLVRGRNGEAIATLQEALRILPSEPLLYHDLGRAYSGVGDWL